MGLAATGADAEPVPDPDRPRTVVIDMEQLAFNTASVSVKAGETVRFVLRNSSYIPHDFTIGTLLMQKGRRALIAELSDAGQLEGAEGGKAGLDAANAVLIMPGETKELIWTFTETRDLEFGCNVPGHYEFGMKGAFLVRPADKPAQAQTAESPQTKLAAWLSDSPAGKYRPTLARRDNRTDFPAVKRTVPTKAKLVLITPPALPKQKPHLNRTESVALVTPPALPKPKPRPAGVKTAIRSSLAETKPAAAPGARKKPSARRIARAGKYRLCSRTHVVPGTEDVTVRIVLCNSP
ncbi:MAG: plastocyanin/azurin family copper-binding protein [Hyphomicrobiales bacterium]